MTLLADFEVSVNHAKVEPTSIAMQTIIVTMLNSNLLEEFFIVFFLLICVFFRFCL